MLLAHKPIHTKQAKQKTKNQTTVKKMYSYIHPQGEKSAIKNSLKDMGKNS